MKKKIWHSGDIITADALNNIEDGIETNTNVVKTITSDIIQMQQDINDLKGKSTSSITTKLSLNNPSIKNSLNNVSTSLEVM